MKPSYFIYIVTAVILFTGCKKQLNREPIGRVTAELIDQEPTINIVTSSVNSSYRLFSNTLNILGSWNWEDGLILRNDFIIQDMASDDMQKKWNPDGDQSWMDDVSKFNFSTSNQAFNGIWSYDYEGISRANRGINYLTNDEIMTKLSFPGPLRDRLLGEAYFLRAMYYFDLVTNFGAVPMLLKPLETFQEAYEVAVRIPADQVWAQIKDDLGKAETLLPNSKYADNVDRWRASKGAAIAMEAKVALFNKEWTTVIDKITALETLGYYDLNTNYFDCFNYRKKFDDKEVIFAADHQTGKTPSQGNGLAALIDWGFVAPTDNFTASFEANDPRLLITADPATKASYKLLGDTTTLFKGNDDSPGNKVYIRWADVLLWKAEALLETNQFPAAIAIINKIRQRARTSIIARKTTMPPAGTLPDLNINATDKVLIKSWLMNERRHELGFENHRLRDLKRWGIAKEVLRALGKNFQDKNYLYPIPQGEVDKSGGTITQNDY